MSLTSCFGNIFSDDSVSKMTLSIDIVVGGNYGQGKFGMFLKFILRDRKEINIDSFVTMNSSTSY